LYTEIYIFYFWIDHWLFTILSVCVCVDKWVLVCMWLGGWTLHNDRQVARVTFELTLMFSPVILPGPYLNGPNINKNLIYSDHILILQSTGDSFCIYLCTYEIVIELRNLQYTFMSTDFTWREEKHIIIPGSNSTVVE